MKKTAKFDRQEVIEKATNLYWKKGFHATSMRNLQEELDMRPASIYATFGSKEGIYKEALLFYFEKGQTKLKTCREKSHSPLQALKCFVVQQVIQSQTQAPNGICLLVKTITELTEKNNELLKLAKDLLANIEESFVQIIQEAQHLGEINTQQDPQNLARYVQIQISGLRTYAKIHSDEKLLLELINKMFTHYPFQ